MNISVFQPFSSLPLVKTNLIVQTAMVRWSLYGLLAVLAQTKFIVSLTTFLLILYTRSIHFVYFVIGSCLTTLLAKALKLYFRQPRPHGQPGYGMPSTHSQAIMFFATYFQCVAHGQTPWLVNGVTLFALAVLWSRVRLLHHTTAQVLVGASLGGVSALLWHAVWLSVFSSLANHSIVIYLFDKEVFLLE